MSNWVSNRTSTTLEYLRALTYSNHLYLHIGCGLAVYGPLPGMDWNCRRNQKKRESRASGEPDAWGDFRNNQEIQETMINTVRKMKEIVPEYKSNNSKNESLDKEIAENR